MFHVTRWEAKLKEKTANGELQDSVKAYLSTFTRGRRFNTQSSDDLSDEDDDDDFMLTAAQSDSDTAMDNATNAYPDEPDDPILPLYNQDEEGYTETDTSIQVRPCKASKQLHCSQWPCIQHTTFI